MSERTTVRQRRILAMLPGEKARLWLRALWIKFRGTRRGQPASSDDRFSHT